MLRTSCRVTSEWEDNLVKRSYWLCKDHHPEQSPLTCEHEYRIGQSDGITCRLLSLLDFTSQVVRKKKTKSPRAHLSYCVLRWTQFNLSLRCRWLWCHSRSVGALLHSSRVSPLAASLHWEKMTVVMTKQRPRLSWESPLSCWVTEGSALLTRWTRKAS